MNHEVKLPGDFYQEVQLEVGVEFAGQMQTAARVGPETTAARHAALATRPDWIDLDQARQAMLAKHYDLVVKDWKKEDGKPPVKPDLTPAQIARGLEMQAAWYEWQALHRVVQLGAIPEPQVLAAAKLLVRSDVNLISAACEVIDNAVASFRSPGRAGDPGSGAGASGRDPLAGGFDRDL